MEIENYDAIVIGGGPAGLTASLYLARAGYHTACIEKEAFGGRILSTPLVANIPGFVSVSGSDFADKLAEQAETNGVEMIYDNALHIFPNETGYGVRTESEYQFNAKVIVLATGTKNRTLGLNESSIKSGLHYCVTCDGPFYKGKDVIVIGGGNSAVTEAIELANIANKVTVLQNLPHLTAEEKLIDKLAELNNVNVILNCDIREYLHDDGILTGVRFNLPSNAIGTYRFKADGVFLAIGFAPQNDIFANVVTLDSRGYIESCKPGVFACGDCTGSKQQVSVACGNGTIAALDAIAYLKSL